jgi:hypothetical protein
MVSRRKRDRNDTASGIWDMGTYINDGHLAFVWKACPNVGIHFNTV